MTYHAAMNATIKGETSKCFGGKKGMTQKKLRMMKLVRYLSRSIHGK
ncbi:hypothetical protein [Pseudomonas syringae]|uniref:Uncharacterized protein n=1 Tax=Pseudomonas syringae pv. actinidiae TaxID=103796 RepID=A0A2P0QFW9_PSESF|nr:hypothetical protein [Pseudomonas syringae]ARO45294.1 hypothetical protein [Pseudomonas syringae pv. actinidiae]